MPEVKQVLHQQLALAWALLEYHLGQLREDDLFWEPAQPHWTVRPVGDTWVPDFAEVEPTPIPAPTIAWLTWHIGWWWSTALAHLVEGVVPRRDQVAWPGDAASTISWLTGLHGSWSAALAATDRLAQDTAYPWPAGSGLRVADMCAWVNVELTKNAAEIGQLLILRRARQGPG